MAKFTPELVLFFQNSKKVIDMAKCELCNKKIRPWFDLCMGCNLIKTGNQNSIVSLMA